MWAISYARHYKPRFVGIYYPIFEVHFFVLVYGQYSRPDYNGARAVDSPIWDVSYYVSYYCNGPSMNQVMFSLCVLY